MLKTFEVDVDASRNIAMQIGELLKDQKLSVGVMALQSALKATICCATKEDQDFLIAAVVMFLTADMNLEDDDMSDQSIH